MMSATEFFDCSSEPPWLVDACEGEIVSQTIELDFSVHVDASSSAPLLDLNHGTEAGPSNSAILMDLDDDVPNPSDFSFGHNPSQEFQRFLQEMNFGGQSERPLVALSLEQQRSWLSVVAPNVPHRELTKKLDPGLSPDEFFRACKKRKRSFA